jgi:DNA-binding MarR family transcriptional regulator
VRSAVGISRTFRESNCMNETMLSEQAQAIASVMPKLTRELVAVERDPAGDLPLAQLRVCGILGDGPRTMSALSREIGVSVSAMTQIADRLERAQLVKRVAEGSDRRVRRLQLAPRGEKILRERHKARVSHVLGVLTHLSPKQRTEVLAAMETLLLACRASKGSETDGDGESPCSAVPITSGKKASL